MPDEEKESKTGTAAELAALYPLDKILTVRVKNGKKYEEREVGVNELPIYILAHMAEAMTPMFEAMPTMPNLLTLAAHHPGEVYKAVGLAIDWSVEDVRRMVGSDFMRVASAVWETNKDFFVPLLGPLLAGVAAAIAQASRGANPSADAGQSASPSSSTTDGTIPTGSPSASSMPQ